MLDLFKEYSLVLTALFAALTAFYGAWLAARFALKRFYKERIWKRKTQPIRRFLKHCMTRVRFDTHYDALERGHDIPSEKAKQLNLEYQKAKKGSYTKISLGGLADSRVSASC